MSTTKRKLRIVGYARLSKKKGDKLATVAVQDKKLRAEEPSITKVFADGGASAWANDGNADRPDFTEMCAWIKRNEVDVVLCVRADRIARDVEVGARFFKLCRRHHVVIIAGGVEYNPEDETAELRWSLAITMASGESTKTSKRTKDAKAESLALCTYSGGRTPFGFRRVAKGEWVQHPVQAKAIRTGFEMIMNGSTLVAVAKRWNDDDVPNAMAKATNVGDRKFKFTNGVVRRMLTSPIVAGLRTTKDDTVVGALRQPIKEGEKLIDGGTFEPRPWPSILTENEHRDLVAVLQARYGSKPSRWHSPKPALLSGLVYCGQCEHLINVRRYEREGRYVYSCTSDGKRCGGVSIQGPKTDALIVAAVVEALDTKRFARKLAKPKKAAPKRTHDIAALRADLQLLADAAARDEISTAEYLTVRKAKQAKLDAALAVEEVADDVSVLAPFDGDADAFLAADLETQRLALSAMFHRITIAPANGPRVFDPERIDPDWKA